MEQEGGRSRGMSRCRGRCRGSSRGRSSKPQGTHGSMFGDLEADCPGREYLEIGREGVLGSPSTG